MSPRMEGIVKIEAAIPYFADKWKMAEKFVEANVRDVARGDACDYITNEQYDQVLWFLHGYNARDVRPKNVS